MPRGKNYVNNNRGVSVQASSKKAAPTMEQCFYGKGCTRTDCFYRHDGPGAAGAGEKSTEPCMPFLAGLCTFSAAGCRKRHPGKAEAEKLIAKYKQMKCRYGAHCKTSGCLYIHPGDGDGTKEDKLRGTAAFPPLAGATLPRPVVPPTGAWKPMQPTGAKVVNTASSPSVPASPPVKSAWQPSPPPAPVWGQGSNPVLANHSSPSPLVNGTVGASSPSMNGVAPAITKKASVPAPEPELAVLDDTPASRTSDSNFLNINAKEFVPGNW